MPQSINCYHHRLTLVAFSQNVLELLFELVFVGPKTAEEKCMSLEILFLCLCPECFFVFEFLYQLWIVIR